MTRRVILLVAAILALTGAVVAALATTHERDTQLRGYVNPIRDSNLPYRMPRLGVNVELTQYGAEELRQHLTWMIEAHVIWVRQEVSWSDLEPEPGVYNWEAWDTIAEAIRETPDLRIIAVFNTSPEWARSDQNAASATAPPDDPATFAVFAREFALRYGAIIDHYQIWDEPNLAVGWGMLQPRPAGYTALLAAAYTAIHAADPGATVITAGLAPTVESSLLTLPDTDFLRELYAAGAGDYFDAVAGKPYGFDTGPDDRVVAENTLNFSRITLLREIMVEHGDGDKAIWASHWGWNSLPDDWTGTPSVWGTVTQQEQVAYTLEALERVEREWPWMGGMILREWQPALAEDDPSWGFALVDPANQPGPLWSALTQHARATTATNGLWAARNAYTSYSGIWTFGPLGADIGWVNDSRVRFHFSGTEVAVLLRQQAAIAHLYPTLKGNAEVNALPHDANGNPFLSLTSGDFNTQIALVVVARGLPDESHTLHLTADELIPDDTVNRWPLVGFAVSEEDLRTPYNRQIAVAWLTALVAALVLVYSVSRLDWQPLNQRFQTVFNGLSDIAQFGLGFVTSFALLTGMLLTWGDSIPALFRREPVQFALALATAGVIYLEPGLILTLLAGVAFFVVIINRIDIGLRLTLFWAPFFLFPVELSQFAFPIAEVILWLTVGAWTLRMLAQYAVTRQSMISSYRQSTLRLRLTSLDWAMIGYVVLGAVSLTWVQRLDPAITEFRTLIVQPTLFYLMLRTIQPDWQRLVDTLLLAGVTVALIGLVQFISGDAVITAEEGTRRLASVYGSPNNVGLFLGRCLPFAAAFLLLRIDRVRTVWGGFALLLMAVAVLLTQSVGALAIGIPISLAAVALLIYQRRAFVPLLLVGILGMVVFFAAMQISPRFERAVDFTEGTNFYRLRVWQSALSAIEDHPVTGLGLDQFLYAYRDIYMLPDAWEEPGLSHPHNIILDYWTRLGLPGVLWLGAVLWLFTRQAASFYPRLRHRTQVTQAAPDKLEFARLVGAMGGMINMVAHGFVDNSVFVLDLAYVFVCFLAYVSGLEHTENTSAIDTRIQTMV